MNIKILLAEEDRDIAEMARCSLSAAGYDVVLCGDCDSLLEHMGDIAGGSERDVWLAILSAGIPGIDCEGMCRALRSESDIPILLAVTEQAHLNAVLVRRMGADDSLIKPYKPVELLGRVDEWANAYLRSRGLPVRPEPESLSIRELKLERKGRKCHVAGRSVALTQIEFAVLWELCRTPGKPVSAMELYRRIWREEYLDSTANTIMVHIRHLRVKLGDDSNPEPYIRTVWREGYRLEP